MTKLTYNGMTDSTTRGRDETQTFLETKPGKEPTIMEESKNMNINYMESAKQNYIKKRNIYPLCGYLLVFVFIAWLVALTMVREFQLADLRKEVEQLKYNTEDIKQKYSNIQEIVDEIKLHYRDDQLFDEMKKFEIEVNAEKPRIRIVDIPNAKPVPGIATNTDESKNPEDDEEQEFYDEDDDDKDEFFIDDYDVNDDQDTEEIDREDFLGLVMEASRPEDIADGEEDYLKTVRSRRSFIEESSDGIQALEGSKVDARNQTDTRYQKDQSMHEGKININALSPYKRLHYHLSTEAPNLLKAANGARNTEESTSQETVNIIRHKRPLMKKVAGYRRNEYDYDADRSEEEPRRSQETPRRHRSRMNHRALELFEDDVGMESRRDASQTTSNNILVAQFHGDTTRHANLKEYTGNGRLQHRHEAPYSAWAPSHWVSPTGMDSRFPLQNGAVTVPETGVYFIYAQIYYHDQHDICAFKVYRSNGVRDEGLLHCVAMTHSEKTVNKTNTCYTAGAFHLNKGDTIMVKNIGDMRYSVMQPGKSFFGLFKLNDSLGS